ncbi:MAG: CvpA family protein [Candidatus Omnitrophota bacterium]
MAITDIVVLLSSAFLVLQGARRGFFGSLLGPLALIFASIISIIYFIGTKNFFISLCIGLLGPLLLTWIFRFFFHSWNKLTNPDGNLTAASRIGGAILSLSWGIGMITITLLLFSLMPPTNKPLHFASNDLQKSIFYHLIKPLNFLAPDENKPKSPQDDIKTLSADQRIQDIINDPQLVESIRNKDYSSIMSNPKIIALTQDPVLLKRMFALYKQVSQQQQLQQQQETNSAQ